MAKSHERRTERATADEVAEVERQLWEFAKCPDPLEVPEAKLGPGGFLYRVHRTWHSLGRGSGLASHSFRALRDELLKRDPPVRNLQPKLYGSAALSRLDAGHLIDVMLETWRVAPGRNRTWHMGPLTRPVSEGQKQSAADERELDAIRENLLQTLFRDDESLVIEEPVGTPPELFYEERGRKSLALIIPTKGETMAHLSPANVYGGFSSNIGLFLEAAVKRHREGKSVPFIIWVLKIGPIRDNPEFHQAFHSLAVYSGCITNWYLRLKRIRSNAQQEHYQIAWKLMLEHSVFVLHGLSSEPSYGDGSLPKKEKKEIDEDLADLDHKFFLPEKLPIVLESHRQVRRHKDLEFGLNVSIEEDSGGQQPFGGRLSYWLFPDRPGDDLDEAAETTGLPVFEAKVSPGPDFDIAFSALYEATTHYLSFSDNERAKSSYRTLIAMGWKFLTIKEFQNTLLVSHNLEP